MKGLSSRGSGEDALRALLATGATRRTFGGRCARRPRRPARAQRASADLGFATVDHDRNRRCGFPEVVFCQGKTPADAAAIARRDPVARRPRADDPRQRRARRRRARGAARGAVPRTRALPHRGPPDLPQVGRVAVVSAGTADLPVAEEAAVTLRIAGNRVDTFTDVGVAGLHRLLAASTRSAGRTSWSPSPAWKAPCLRCSPGCSTGRDRGADQRRLRRVFGGLTALLTMLNSCAAGVAVVNIDNGFGAGYLASQINLRTAQPPTPR
jgi:NCAIR mutase (PurE)-related protein